MKQPKKKILYIVQLPPPVHGVSVMNQYAYDNPIVREKYEVDVLPLHFGQTLQDIGKITVGKLMRMFVFMFRLAWKMIRFRPQLVYFTIMPTGKIFYRDAVFTSIIKLFGPKLVFHLHGKGIREAAEGSGFNRWLYKKTFKHAYLISLSPRLTADISTVYPGKPFVLPNGIVNTSPQQLERISNDSPLILFLSNLVLSKGIKVFLEAVLELKNDGIPFNAWIIGNSADYSIEEARRFVQANSLSQQVQVLGPRYGKEKEESFKQADIFVLPSLNECFPVSILEAMQFRLPVIASAIGGIPDMISEKKEGLLVQPGDVSDLKEKLALLLLNATLRKELGFNGQNKFIQNYTIEHYNQGLANIFDQILY